jgi:dGTPase
LEDPVYVEQRQILKELFGYLLEGAPDSLQPEFQADFAAARTEGDQTRVVVDQLASLTDSSAMIEHRRFTAGSEHGAAAWPAL